MRKVITETIVYTFNELSPEAKEKVKEWYLAGQDSEVLKENHQNFLAWNFPKSNLHIQFDFGCGQGSGYNIYGDVDYCDFIDWCNKNGINTGLTEEECKALKWYDSQCYLPLKLACNRNYTYFCQSVNDVENEILDEIEWQGLRDINYVAITKLSYAVVKVFDNICGALYKDGDKFFNEVDEQDLAEICKSNNWEFTAEGEVY